MTEVIYAVEVMTIIYIIIAIPIILFLSSLTYHYADELNKYNQSKRINKTFNDGYEIVRKYNDVLRENEKLREKLIDGDVE